MAISSLISSKALFSSVVECRCNGELKPMPAGSALRLALGRRRRFDWARFRSLDFENSLTACTRLRQHMPVYQSALASRIISEAPLLAVCAPIGLVVDWYSHIFLAILVNGQVNCAKRPAANLLSHQVLVDAVLGSAVILAVTVLGTRIERFLSSSAPACTQHMII
jgi:hypothetical protein